MKSNDQNLHEFLEFSGGQLTIPIYQRSFVWDMDEYQRLFEDIIGDDNGHWLDRTVIKKFNDNICSGDYYEIHIIDGQQRITSIIVLYTAICAWCKNHDFKDIEWEKNIYKSILINDKFEGNNKYKLRLSKYDTENNRVLWECIDKLPKIGEVTANKRGRNNENKILKMYNAFYSMLNKDNICEIYNNIRKVEIINAECDKNDDGQKIFNSINSTGKPLKKYEICKNLSLMNLGTNEQDEYYFKYWLPLIEYFGTHVNVFDSFILMIGAYLKGNYSTSDNLIKYFTQKFFNNNNEKEFFNILEKCFEWYQICEGEREPHISEMKDVLTNLKLYKMDARIYPIIFKIFYYYENEQNTNDLLKSLELLNVHVFRGIMSNKPLNLLFKNIKLENINENITHSLYGCLNKVLPFINDSVFKNQLMMFNKWYGSKYNPLLKHVLCKIENTYHSKEKIDFSNASIEHIMPQTLTNEWKKELGIFWEDIHQSCLNKIGNLTIAPYNSELSNNSFAEKKAMKNGFEEDRNYLSRYICKFNEWDKDSINKRSEYLADILLDIYKYPEVYPIEF